MRCEAGKPRIMTLYLMETECSQITQCGTYATALQKTFRRSVDRRMIAGIAAARKWTGG